MSAAEYTFQATPEMAQAGARRLMGRRAGRAMLFFYLVIGGCACLLIAGNRHWPLFVGPAVSIWFILQWRAYCRKAAEPYAAMSDPTTRIVVEDDGISMVTVDRSSKMKWSLVKEVWRYPDLWLIFFYSDAHYTILSTDGMSDYIATKIADEVTAAGGTVR